MSPHVTAPLQQQKLSALQIILLALFLVVCGFGFVSSTAQAPPKEEREFEDKTPKHLPIKITIKNPEKVKDLKNENWLRDLEIEVENKSNKPIYYLGLSVILDDVTTEDGYHIGFPLRYGRSDLILWTEPLQSDDVPIKPGETYIFKIPENPRLGWERHAAQQDIPKSAPKKVRITFQSLNFGDGTGFGTTEGVPIDIHKSPSNSSCIGNEKKESVLSAWTGPPNQSSILTLQLATIFLPARFLPVNFSPAITTKPTASGALTASDICCPG